MGALPGSSLSRTMAGGPNPAPSLGNTGLGGAVVGATRTTAAVATSGNNPKASKTGIFQKVAQILQDNRAGDREAVVKLRSQNEEQADSNQILKKILNIIFLVTGLALLVAVIIVIVYTAAFGRCSGRGCRIIIA